MKKILFLAAVTILAAVSCNKIEEEGANTFEPSNVPSFVASVDGADTKTVIDGMKSYWDGTEGIRVFDGKLTKGKVYTATVEKAETATFKETDSEVTLNDKTSYLAVYPEGPAGGVTWSGDITVAAKKFWLPGDQIAVPNSYDPSTHIAVAYSESGDVNLNFKNVTSLIKVNLTSDNVTEICFYGNNSDVIAGNFDVKYNNGQPTWTKGGGYPLAYAKVKNTDGTALKKGVYYISVLPTTLTNGFSIETVSNGVKSIKKNSKPYTIGRNQIVDLGAIEWVAPSEELSRIIYLDVTKNWNGDNAKFAAHFWGGAGTNPSPVMMTKVSGTQHIYECKIDKDATDIIFVRKAPNSNTTNNLWDGEWNRVQTKLQADKNLFKITDWSAGTWSNK